MSSSFRYDLWLCIKLLFFLSENCAVFIPNNAYDHRVIHRGKSIFIHCSRHLLKKQILSFQGLFLELIYFLILFFSLFLVHLTQMLRLQTWFWFSDLSLLSHKCFILVYFIGSYLNLIFQMIYWVSISAMYFTFPKILCSLSISFLLHPGLTAQIHFFLLSFWEY